MYKTIVVVLAFIGCTLAEPKPEPGVFAAPVAVAPHGVVTAQSSQVFARNYNGFVAPPPVVAAPLVRHHAPLIAPHAFHPHAAPLLAAAPALHAHAAYYNPYFPGVGHYHVAPSAHIY